MLYIKRKSSHMEFAYIQFECILLNLYVVLSLIYIHGIFVQHRVYLEQQNWPATNIVDCIHTYCTHTVPDVMVLV